MNICRSASVYAEKPYYYAPEQNIHGETIHAIWEHGYFDKFDMRGTAQYLEKSPDISRTCFQGIQKLTPNHSLNLISGKLNECERVNTVPSHFNLRFKLIELLTSYSLRYERCALALSGGFDSALLLSLIKEARLDNFEIYTLRTNLKEYCEYEITKKTANYFGVELHEIMASASDFVDRLPSVIRSTETPIYNLHLVSKSILADAIKNQGVNCLVTGDGADQAFSGSESKNYLPLVGSIMRDIGINYESPFFNNDIVSYGETRQHKDKLELKKINSKNLPSYLINQIKKPRLTPAFDIGPHWNERAVNWASTQLGLKPELSNDASKTLWTSLGILSSNFFSEQICAA